uniref:Immunoglobulin domain-containing protein n=1 Tax=Mastacembelus armatus TaxID=205130 RepID=A0A3Q3LCS4_9TELE
IYKLFNVLSLLFVSGWISVSAAESQTVKVQPGEEVNLLCPNMSKYDGLMFWIRLVNGTKIGCISVMYRIDEVVSYCDGFQSGTFEMSSNISTVFLKIKQVVLSDSGLYFCGFYIDGQMLFNTVHLNVKGKTKSNMIIFLVAESDGTSKLISVILGGVTVSLVVLIIGLTVQNRKLQRGTFQSYCLYIYFTLLLLEILLHLSQCAKPKRNQRPASERQLEPNVVYAATR